jgi:DnaK suppressor protein
MAHHRRAQERAMSRHHESASEAMRARLAALIGRQAKIASHLRGEDGRRDADFEDVVSYVSNDEVLEGLDDAARREILEIRAAFARIEDGSFGRCETCGREIPAGRLAVLPQVRTCVACATAAEA